MVNFETYAGTAALQLQRAGAALLSAARSQHCRHPGESVERAQRSCRATKSPSGCDRGFDPIAERYGARIKVAEVPPGPPVLETLVAEVYGPITARIALARQMRDLSNHYGVVDVDWYVEDAQPKYGLIVDQEKAALNGISEDDVARTMQIGLAAPLPGCCIASEKEDVPIRVRLDRADTLRSGAHATSLQIAGRGGQWCRLGEAVHVEKVVKDKSIYHKNLMPVTYVTADIAGQGEPGVRDSQARAGDRQVQDSRGLSDRAAQRRHCPTETGAMR